MAVSVVVAVRSSKVGLRSGVLVLVGFEWVVTDGAQSLRRVLGLVAVGEEIVRAATLVRPEQLHVSDDTGNDDGGESEKFLETGQSEDQRQEEQEF